MTPRWRARAVEDEQVIHRDSDVRSTLSRAPFAEVARATPSCLGWRRGLRTAVEAVAEFPERDLRAGVDRGRRRGGSSRLMLFPQFDLEPTTPLHELVKMIPTLRAVRSASRAPALFRSYASEASPSTLILLEHRNDAIVPATLNAITAAKKVGGKVTGLIVGEEASTKAVVEKAQK